MEIELVRQISLEELVDKLRLVPLKAIGIDGAQVFPYKDARITLRELAWREVNPTSFYVLSDGIERQRQIREQLIEKYGLDSLHLRGALEIANEKGEIWTLTPPITELTSRVVRYVAREGEKTIESAHQIEVLILNDGLHRVFLARESDETFHGIHIIGAPATHPFYAHPNEWEMVRMVDEVPGRKEDRKLYSRDDCYALYRDFGVLGCGAPRGKEGG